MVSAISDRPHAQLSNRSPPLAWVGPLLTPAGSAKSSTAAPYWCVATKMPVPARSLSLLRRLLPVLDWLPAYRRDWLLPDVLAGLAVWAVMVPEGMAYAGIVGVPAIMG